ncbi:MAG: hypothetical protein ISS51_00430 [Dehalococcoidales bacterium]|nr:hypothetical protein [Dehalococcoidales bacterium]
MARICENCGHALGRYNPGKNCYACQEKRREGIVNMSESPNYDVGNLAYLLDLSEAQVKRNENDGKIPPRIPGIRKYLWPKKVIDYWRESGFRPYWEDSEVAEAVLYGTTHGWNLVSMTFGGRSTEHPVERYREAKKFDEEVPRNDFKWFTP